MTIKVDETTLLTFLLDWQAWAGSFYKTSPLGVSYSKSGGLCRMADEFMLAVYDKYTFADRYTRCHTLRMLMHERWAQAGLPEVYPFGRARYYEDHRYQTMHMCHVRLQWVADTIAELTNKDNSHDDQG